MDDIDSNWFVLLHVKLDQKLLRLELVIVLFHYLLCEKNKKNIYISISEFNVSEWGKNRFKLLL